MSKKLRVNEVIYIAPGISGMLDENGDPIVFDERKKVSLDPRNIDDKIKIYKRQVKEWFLKPAARFLRGNNNGFVVLMICMSYLEGIEQYRRGQNTDNGGSRAFFVSALENIYPGRYNRYNLEELYREARCGLFHNGMVRGKIIMNSEFTEPLDFPDPTTIKVSPKKLLADINNDFAQFLVSIKTDRQIRSNFDRMFSNI